MNTDSLKQELVDVILAKNGDAYSKAEIIESLIATKVQEARLDEINMAELKAISSDYVWRYLRNRQAELQALKDKEGKS